MTNEYLQQKFGELIYELGEINFSAIKDDFWQKHINENQNFNEKQLECLRNFSEDLIEHELKEITKKISGYKRQDIDKDIYSKNTFISLEELIEKLLCSKLKCFYCKCECELIYENVLSKRQWTLDRIENDAGHNPDNVVICCLECNLKRGTMDSGRFKYGKQLKFKKVG